METYISDEEVAASLGFGTTTVFREWIKLDMPIWDCSICDKAYLYPKTVDECCGKPLNVTYSKKIKKDDDNEDSLLEN